MSWVSIKVRESLEFHIVLIEILTYYLPIKSCYRCRDLNLGPFNLTLNQVNLQRYLHIVHIMHRTGRKPSVIYQLGSDIGNEILT